MAYEWARYIAIVRAAKFAIFCAVVNDISQFAISFAFIHTSMPHCAVYPYLLLKIVSARCTVDKARAEAILLFASYLWVQFFGNIDLHKLGWNSLEKKLRLLLCSLFGKHTKFYPSTTTSFAQFYFLLLSYICYANSGAHLHRNVCCHIIAFTKMHIIYRERLYFIGKQCILLASIHFYFASSSCSSVSRR